MLKPKILVLDIETSPLLCRLWSLWDQGVSIDQIDQDSFVMAWCAKWMGSEEIFYKDQRNAKNLEDDSKILKPLRDLIDEADIVLTHNGRRFDHKKLNARFLVHRFLPPSSYRMIDTLQIVKKHFGFTSNKLGYLTKKLNEKYTKLDHREFPGFELWKECMNGNAEAWESMEKYNKHDVLALEELYERLKPWDSDTNFFVYQDEHICRCGSYNFKKRGFHYAKTRKYQRYKCKECGYEWRDTKAIRCLKYTSTVNS